MNPEGKEFLTPQELADLLRTTRATIYEYIKAGKLKGIKLGRRRLFPREEVDAFLQTKTGSRLKARAMPDSKELREACKMLKEGDALRRKGESKETIALGASLRSIFANAGDHRGLAHAQFIEGSGYLNARQLTKAVKKLSEALSNVRKTDDRMLEAQICGTLGQTERFNRNYGVALFHYQVCMRIFTEIGAKGKVANVYRDIGSIYKISGSPVEGIANLKKAHEIARKVETPHTFLPRLLNSIADTYYELGDLPQALKAAELARGLALKRNMKVSVCHALTTMGKALEGMGDTNSATEIFHQSLRAHAELTPELQDRYIDTAKQSVQGIDDFPRFLKILRRWDKIHKNDPFLVNRLGWHFWSYAVCWEGLNKPGKALEYITLGMEKQIETGALTRLWLFHLKKAECLSALGRHSESCDEYTEGFHHLDRESIAASREGIRGSFSHFMSYFGTSYASEVVKCPDDGRALEFHLGIAARDVRLLIAESSIYPDPLKERDTARKYVRNENGIITHFAENGGILPGTQTRQRIKQRLGRLDELRRKKQKLLRVLHKRNPAYLPLQGENGPSIDEIKSLYSRKIIPSKVSILFPFLSKQTIDLFVVGKKGISAREQVHYECEGVKELIHAFTCECQIIGTLARSGKPPSLSEQQNLKSLSTALYDVLFKPIEGSFDATEPLVLVTGNLLSHLPFNALYDGEKYLCEYLRISRLMSSAFLRLPRLGNKSTNGKPKLMFVSPDDEQDVAPIIGNLNHIPKRQKGMMLGSKAVISRVRPRIAKYDAFVYTGGIFPHDERPQRSNLIMNEGPGLSANELFSQRYDLSGLKAAILHYNPKDIRNDKSFFQPMETGFLTSGARMVAPFLWEMDKSNLGRLLGEIFRDFTSRDWSGAEAIRQAQIKLINDPLTSHPYFWAGVMPYSLRVEK